MLRLKELFLKERFYLSLMFSMMMNTVCSRLVDQTDLVMMKRLSEDAAASLLCVKNISFVDFVIALAIVPIFGIIVRKSPDDERERTAGQLARKFSICALATTFLCAFLYPLFVIFSVKSAELRSMSLFLIFPLIVNLPGKMMQFLFSTFLCIFKKTRFVSIFWVITVLLNFALNTVFMGFFGYIGCLISTVVVTLIVSASFFAMLANKFGLARHFFDRTPLSLPAKSIVSEGFRIVTERIVGYLFFLMSIHFATKSDFTNIGIIGEISNLFLVPSVTGMRSTSLSLSNETSGLKSKVTVNFLISVFEIVIFLVFFNLIVKGVYAVELYESNLFTTFRITFPILLLVKGVDSVLRGFYNFRLRQPLLFKIDTISKWLFYLPLCLIIFYFGKSFLCPLATLLQSLLELAVLFAFYKRAKA